MTAFDLYYWPFPFRGQFIRAILAYAGKRWDEHDSDAIGKLMAARPQDQPIAFMGPPVLIDRRAGFALAEMPAIALYLGETLSLLPETPDGRALSVKIVNDANDVIDELTLDGGREMWTRKTWNAFVPRLKKWMAIWEATGICNGLESDRGFLLGTEHAGVADIVTSTLWSTMSERFSDIARIFDETAPRIAGLTRRMQELPPLAALAEKTRQQYGDDTYCGGEIEKSLRAVAG